MPQERKTLTGRDYSAAEVFDLERERIFARNWFYAGRAEGLDEHEADGKLFEQLGRAITKTMALGTPGGTP